MAQALQRKTRGRRRNRSNPTSFPHTLPSLQSQHEQLASPRRPRGCSSLHLFSLHCPPAPELSVHPGMLWAGPCPMEQEPGHRQKQHQPLADRAGSPQPLTLGSLGFSPSGFLPQPLCIHNPVQGKLPPAHHRLDLPSTGAKGSWGRSQHRALEGALELGTSSTALCHHP